MKLGNPNGAAALRRAGKGGVALRTTVSRNADDHARDLALVLADIQASGHRSLRAMATELTRRSVRTRCGGQWQVSNVGNLIGRLNAAGHHCPR